MKGKKLFQWMPALVALCVLVEGLFFIGVTLPGHVPDIWAHVYRVDAILNGDIVARPVSSRSMLHNTENGVVGGAVNREWMQYSLEQYDGYDPAVVIPESVKDGSNSTVDLPFNNTAVNSPVVYAPQLVGFAAGRVLSLSAGITYYLAEVCMLGVYVLLMYCSVRVLPKWRIPVGLLLCLPQMVRLASFSISADSVTQGMAILFSCLLFREIVGKRSVSSAVRLAVVSVILAMCKFIYVPLVLLSIPTIFDSANKALDDRTRLHINRGRAIPILIGMFISGVWVLSWLKINAWYTNCPMMVSYEQMTARKRALLTDPDVCVDAIGNIVWAMVHAQSNMNVKTSSVYIALCWLAILMVLILLFFVSVRTAGLNKREPPAVVGACLDGSRGRRLTYVLPLPYAWLIVLLCIGDILLIYLALWLQYNPSGTVGVDGMQYRYFLPLAALFAIVASESMFRLFSFRHEKD